ncbi:MAG TPA: hypothetical protein VHH36_01635 [Candidatus Thermoplasmatota archaeon]|nr:hypothetical protein [Candidatus Thermoplasmatota archaeon]
MKHDALPTPVANHQQASAAVTAALGTLDFPISKREAIRKVGDWSIPVASDLKVPLGNILRGVPEDDFADVSQAANAVDRHWGRIAQSLHEVEKAEKRAKRQARR